ncbi:MAG: 30S ribosomal protein S4e [Candidatus Aenigmatarchaeota archaeon]
MAKLKRLLAPAFWKIVKKEKKWVVAPKPGPHKKFESIPLLIIIRDILKLVDLGSEARKIIKRGEILVDGKARKDHAYPCGLFDVISIPKLKKNYRIVPKSKGLDLIEISDEEAKLKIFKIKNKTKYKGNKVQLNLHDGKNILVEKDAYKTGDSLLVELPNLKIKNHLKLEKGSVGIITGGKNQGELGKVKEIIPGKFRSPTKIICEILDKETEVSKENFFVVGKDKPLIKISD